MGKTDSPTIVERARKSDDDIMRMVGRLPPRKLGDSLKEDAALLRLSRATFRSSRAKGRGTRAMVMG